MKITSLARSLLAAEVTAHGASAMSQIRRENAIADQLLDVADALVARPLELVERQPGLAIGGVELLGAAARVPLRLEGRQHAGDLVEADAVGALVGPGVRRHLDPAARHHVRDDLGDVADAVIVRGAADIERLVVDTPPLAPRARR